MSQVIPKPPAPEIREWQYKEINNHMCFASLKDIENFTYTMEQIFKYNLSLQDYATELLNLDTKGK